jgi:DNA-binding CsgD family transcriptional regulator
MIFLVPENDRLDRLTDRQRDCLSLVAQGFTSKEIGRQLGLSPSTIDNHILAAMQVLDAPSRAAAARKLSSSLDRQKMPSQSATLANSHNQRTMHPEAVADVRGNWAKNVFALPPLGGQKNDLGWAERTIRIFQVAVLSLGALLSLALVIAGAFALFR